MSYFLIRLRFNTAVHFGASDSADSLSLSLDHILADTLFSALCHTALQLYGDSEVERLISMAKAGSFKLSDTMPWRVDEKGDDEWFLPKPMIRPRSDTQTANTHKIHAPELSHDEQKSLKKLKWISVHDFYRYIDSLNGGDKFDTKSKAVAFGHDEYMTRVAVTESSGNTPYRVGLYRFCEDCGLYAIAEIDGEYEERLASLLYTLGCNGLGGKVTSGLGKFDFNAADDMLKLVANNSYAPEWLYYSLTNSGGANMLLTSSLPRDDELEASLDGASYLLVRRGGFAMSESFAPTPTKKRTQYFFRAGSMFERRYDGDVYIVGKGAAHSIYRYSKPIFLGVEV